MKTLGFFIRSIGILLSFTYQINGFTQNIQEGFRFIPVNKMVKEFPDKFDLSSPLQAGVSICYIFINGTDSLWNKVEVERYRKNDGSSVNLNISESVRLQYLYSRIIEVMYYKDFIAAVISQLPDSTFRCRWLEPEKGKWYNTGEDMDKTLDESQKRFTDWADNNLKEIRQFNMISAFTKDTIALINYIKNYGSDPKEMVLQTLSDHKIVAYGEIHRRLWSWNFCRSILNDPRFPNIVGTIYLEISSNSQNNLDKFLESDTLNKELIYETLRDISENGWNDKGMFDFIMDVWKVNQNLPKNKRIKIVAIDIPRPWSIIMTKSDAENYFYNINRDSIMASIIKHDLIKTNDKRNTFFIVGSGHLYKTSTNAGTYFNVGSILSKNYSKDKFFIYWSHCPRITNHGEIFGKIRHGIFDYAFFKMGNKPIAFNLGNCPFGKEPFDGLPDLDGSGTYADNYDGYIFLGPLEEEPNGEPLYELYNDAFIKEMERRDHLYGENLEKSWGIQEGSKSAIIEKIKETHSPLRWGKIPNN
jgi:hypothetical protein